MKEIPNSTESYQKFKEFFKKKTHIHFLFLLILVNLWWFWGTKVSELLVDSLVSNLGGAPLKTLAEIQKMDSIYNFVVAGSVIIFGLIVDRFPEHRKSLLIIINLSWVVANFIIATIPITLTLYLLLQIIWGIVNGANGPIIFSYLGDLFAIQMRGRLFSTFAIMLYFIKGTSSIATGLIGFYLGSWKSPLLITATAQFISLIIFLFFAKEPKLGQIEPEFKDKIENGNPYKYRLEFKEIKTIFRQKSNFLFLIQGIFGMIGVVNVQRYLLYWLTSNIQDGLGMSAPLATILLAVSGGIGALIGINLSGWYVDRQFQKGRLDKMLHFAIISVFGQVFVYALLIFVPAYPSSIDSSVDNIGILLQAYPGFWLFILFFNICLFMGTAIGPVVGTARTHINLPEHRGTAAALYDTFDFVGAGIALLIGSYISTITESFKLVIFISSLSWIISGFIWITITKFINSDYQEIRNILKERAEKGI